MLEDKELPYLDLRNLAENKKNDSREKGKKCVDSLAK